MTSIERALAGGRGRQPAPSCAALVRKLAGSVRSAYPNLATRKGLLEARRAVSGSTPITPGRPPEATPVRPAHPAIPCTGTLRRLCGKRTATGRIAAARGAMLARALAVEDVHAVARELQMVAVAGRNRQGPDPAFGLPDGKSCRADC